MGRLFDAVAALAGVRQVVTYEAQAAIELEMLVDEAEQGAYEWELTPQEGGLEIGPAPVMRAVLDDVRAGTSASIVAARFHNAVAALVAQVCGVLRDETGLNEVALSGGVWQNMTLLAKTLDRLRAGGFTVYVHRLVPPNDGGLALGQAAIANFSAA
jgi:hydrogenase maturation protein HypF